MARWALLDIYAERGETGLGLPACAEGCSGTINRGARAGQRASDWLANPGKSAICRFGRTALKPKEQRFAPGFHNQGVF